jgi:hypothetical protein
MVVVQHGTVINGGIALDNPLPIPDGSKIIVQVEVQTPTTAPDLTSEESSSAFAALPFFGQWADRTDLPDSVEYVRQERAKWLQRPYRQD